MFKSFFVKWSFSLTYGGIAGSGGIQEYNLPEGIYTVKVEANGSWSEMTLSEYIISNNSDGTIT